VVGKGTVIITGDGENYYGQKKVTFLILPKWAMWIWIPDLAKVGTSEVILESI